jgi:hypothetical protein
VTHSSRIGRIALALTVAAVVAAYPNAQHNREFLLDLVDVTPPSRESDPAPDEQLRVAITGRVTPAGSPKPVRPVSISLESLDRTWYVIGDRVVYEAIGDNAKRQSLDERHGLIPIGSVAHDPGQVRNLRQPPAVALPLELNRKRHASTLGACPSNHSHFREALSAGAAQARAEARSNVRIQSCMNLAPSTPS